MTKDVRSLRARLCAARYVLALLALLAAMPAVARVTGLGEGVVPAGSGGGVHSLSVGSNYVCALRWDGNPQCWGENYNGQASPPYQSFVAMRSGDGFSCGLDAAGELACWGANYAGQTQPPPGPFTSFDLGRDRGCAIRPNGDLACWGTNADGSPVTPPAGAFKAVAVGEYRICGLRTDGQIGCSDQSEQNPAPGGEFIAISAGAMHTCALRADGHAECWPSYSFPYGTVMPIADTFAEISVGEGYSCGLRTDGNVSCWGAQESENLAVPAGRFVTVVAGNHFACGVRPEGPVECWNEAGYSTLYPPMELTDGTLSIRREGQPPETGGRVRALASGTDFSCALLGDRRVMCWGSLSMTMPPMGEGFDALVAGSRHACGLRRDDRRAMCWGEANVAEPEQAFESLAAGEHFTCGLRDSGRVFCWGGPYGAGREIDGAYVAIDAGGSRACGLRADGNSECWEAWDARPPQRTQLVSQQRLQSVSTGARQSCGLDIAGRSLCWLQPGDSAHEPWTPEPLVTLSVGEYNACGLSASGRLHCLDGYYHPDYPYADNFTALSLGRDHGCGLRADGTVRCWGNNYAGQATPPRELTVPYAIDAGDRHTCALQPDGELGCWGDNANGQTNVPNEPWLPAFVGVGSGDEFSCGLREDGRVQCWGQDANGQLQPPMDTLLQISIGRQHGCGIGSDGQVRCWGWNSNGQAAGPNDGYTRYLEVSAGFVHSCGVTEMGEGRCWGYNGEGQTMVPYLESGRQWTSIKAGDQHSCGLRDDGVIQCWGSDRDGQVHNVPTGYFRALSAGAFHNCAIRNDGRLACWGGNWAGQTNAPEGMFVAVTAGSHHSCAINAEGVKQCWGDNTHLQAPPRSIVPPHAGDVPLHAPYSVRLALIDGHIDPWGYPGGSGQPIEGAIFRLTSGALPPGLSLSPDGFISGEAHSLGTYTATITAVDAAGFGASRHFEWVVDGSPPEIYPYISTASTNGWYTGNVYLQWIINDPEASEWIVSGCDWTSLSWDTPGVTYQCTAQSAGGTTTQSITLKRDATAPETNFTSTPPTMGNQASSQLAFTGSDATSGVSYYECSLDNAAFARCTSPYTVAGAGSHNFRVRAVDNAGNRDVTPASHSWMVDTSAPGVTPAVTGTLGANGWYVGDVQISWTVVDAESTITSTSGCNAVSVVADTTGASFTCTATSAGGTTLRTVSIKRDATAPLVVAAATSASNAAGWYRGDVGVAFSCSDTASGLVTCPTAQLLGGEGTVTSTAMTITDAAGNRATSNVVTVKIDRTAPALVPSASPGLLLLNATGQAEANATDALSGVATEYCEALATGSVGSKTVRCSATDAAGNTATAFAGYRVAYGFQGFNAPVQNPSVLNVLKAGRAVPLRWRVVDAQGAPVSTLTAASITPAAIGCPGTTENRITSYGGSNGQLQNLGNGYYQLDWTAASSLRGACRRLELDLGDAQIHPALFKFN